MATSIYQTTNEAEAKLIESIDWVPWWLFDRLPQGFAGKVYAKQIIKQRPEFSVDLRDWSDEVVLESNHRPPPCQDVINGLIIQA